MGVVTLSDMASAGGMTSCTVASRVAFVCAMISRYGTGSTTLSARRVAAVSAMIDELAQGRRRRTTRKRRMANYRCYQRVSKLGHGTYGVVVKARHLATDQIVAMKTLREACFMAACGGHPSLVALRGVVRAPGGATGRTSRDYFLVMEYAGRNLHQVLQEPGRAFPEAEVRCIVRQLLAGAEAMHRLGIKHRDIKPANIFVVQDGGGGVTIKIGDYGLAISTAERAHGAAGTLDFMAPEVLLEEPRRGTRVDLWSIGCVMAELLTGDTLFAGDDKADHLHKIFDVLGVPGERAWRAAFNSKLFGEEVQLWRARQRLAAGPKNRLRRLIPKKLLSEDGFEVLKGLLTCNPHRRLDTAAALRHPWFADTAVLPVAAVHNVTAN